MSIGFTSNATDIDTTSLLDQELILQELVEEVLTNQNLDVRQESSDELEVYLERILNDKASYKHEFSRVRGISIVQPENKKFRIFTWQLYVDKDNYQYKGFIQTAEGKVFKLQDKSADMRTVEFSLLKPENWYGALYYNLQPFKHEGEDMYLLFGYDAFEFYNRRKVVDVLYFDSSGRPRFGKTLLEMKDGRGRKRNVKRFLLEYSSSVNVSLNYDKTQELVIFDHLIYGSPIKGGGPSSVPDGSYCGMKLTKSGTWEYVDKVYKDDPANVLINATNYDEMINNASEPKKKKKDIFGRSK